MAFTKITDADLQNKGVIGLPDTPGLSTTEMQEKFDEIALDVLYPKHNGLIDEMEASTAAISIGAKDIEGNDSTVQDEFDNRYAKSEINTLLDNKVDKDGDKVLSTNDFTDAYKSKLAGVEDNANNYVLPKAKSGFLGGVMPDNTTFTVDENGVGHAVGGGGGGTADYDALANKPKLNGSAIMGDKQSEDYGILRPYLVITTEAGSSVSISKGGVIIDATQISGSTTQWEVCPTSYGTWIVSSDLPGADVATASITIDAVKTYSITVNHITSTITATYPSGASYCKCYKGSVEYVATQNPQTFTVRSIGNWTVETSLNDIVKTATVSITADNQSQSVSIEYASITVNYDSNFKGKTITCTDGTTTYTKVAPNDASSVVFTIPNTGSWTVSATVSGTPYTQTVSVSGYTSYSTSLEVFSATITVTFPYSLGASCIITDGSRTLTATTSPMAFNIPNTGTWTATCSLDGATETGSKTITTSGQTESITFTYGTINLTYDNDFRGLSLTCYCSPTTITKTAPSASNTMVFYPNKTGTWTISGTYSGQTYSTSVAVSSLGTPVSTTLNSIPVGSTVTPTNVVQTWLKCAGINKSYTTVNQVLADSTTLLALISSNNAVDYMVRSTTWASTICANSTAMTDIGANNYCANKLLANSTWCSAICNSTYFESVLTTKVPTMTSNTTPSGVASASSVYSSPTYDAYHAFDNYSSGWHPQKSGTQQWVQYEFPSACAVRKLTFQNVGGSMSHQGNVKLRGSNNNSTFTDIDTFISNGWSGASYNTSPVAFTFTNNTTYKYYRVEFNNTSEWNMNSGVKFQFYGR